MVNSPKVIANLTDEDLELETLLSKEYEDTTDEDFERQLQIICDHKDAWHLEELKAQREGKKPNPRKGLKKPSAERKKEIEAMVLDVDLRGIG